MSARKNPVGDFVGPHGLELAARSSAGQHYLRILQTILRHQRIKRGCILW